jgi:hypothetical protein
VSSTNFEDLYRDLSSNLLLFPASKLQISSALYFRKTAVYKSLDFLNVGRLSVLRVCDAVPVGIWFPTFRDKEVALKRREPNTKNIPEERIPQIPTTWLI